MDLLILLQAILELLQITDRSISAYLVAAFLVIQAFVLIVLAVAVAQSRLRRAFHRRDNAGREKFYRDQIHLVAEEEDFTKQYAILEGLNRKFSSEGERGFFRRLLVDAIVKHKDRGRIALLGLYRGLKFLEDDRTLSQSLFWWNRLAAVIRLEKLAWTETIAILEPLIDDKYDLVALGAIRAMSALSIPEKNFILLEALSRRAPTRQDLFLGILLKIGRAHPESLIQYLDRCYDPLHASFAVLALAQLNIRQALPVILQLARSSSDEVAKTVASALGMMKSVETEIALEGLLNHSNAEVRAQAILSLVPMQPSKRRSFSVQQLSEDPSVEVQRALFEIQELMRGLG